MDKRIRQIKKFSKIISVPADKSITHRAILFGAIAKGRTEISNPLLSEDCLNTLLCVKKLGARAELINGRIIIEEGLGGREFNSCDLFAGNSGTTARLLSGILAAQEGKTFTFDGDDSLRKRPMKRIEEPLSLMGADVKTTNGKMPLTITGKKLNGIKYDSAISSAQVKSAILLAGLYAEGETTVKENIPSRDHTERMLAAFKANITADGTAATVKKSILTGRNIEVCGDISSAAFAMVLSLAKEDGYAVIKNVGINPSRTGIIKVLKESNADIKLFNERTECGEPVCDIEIKHSLLKPFIIDKETVPSLIDEIPILAVLACFIKGESVIKGAAELKVKESNRIDTVVNAIRALGGNITPLDDGMIIKGTGSLKGGAEIITQKDHRIAMSMAVAGALSQNGCIIKDAECCDVSYPGFYALLEE